MLKEKSCTQSQGEIEITNTVNLLLFNGILFLSVLIDKNDKGNELRDWFLRSVSGALLRNF